MNILLASQSPRRRELLAALGYNFETVSIDCEEILPTTIHPTEAAGYLSKLKANAYNNLLENEVLITSDTTVVLDDKILGKPNSTEEAQQMLRDLSGKVHKVYTGITLTTIKQSITEIDVAEVEFDMITDQEITYYLENFNPYDKAGSYGIQDWLGMAKIKRISGSYYTIMGLPTHILYQLLIKIQSIN